MSDKFSLYQTDGLWGIIENASNEKQTSIKSYFGSDLIIKRLNEQADQIDQLKQQLAETEQNFFVFQEDSARNEQIYVRELAEKDKEIEDLKKWKEWYSIWHENFKKQIKDLTTELETYRPTKLHGNGQCKCFNCNAINWTDWCNKYKGHIYCDDCLKEILKEEQTLQTQLAIQELDKVKILLQNAVNYEGYTFVGLYDAVNNQIKELKGE